VSPARPQRHRDRIGEDVDAAQHLGPRVRAEQYQLSRHRSVLLSLDDAEDVLLAEDQGLLAVELDLGAGVLAEQYPVAGLHVERQDLAVLRLTGTDRTGERVGSRFITRSTVLSQDAVGFETARGRLPLPLAEF